MRTSIARSGVMVAAIALAGLSLVSGDARADDAHMRHGKMAAAKPAQTAMKMQHPARHRMAMTSKAGTVMPTRMPHAAMAQPKMKHAMTKGHGSKAMAAHHQTMMAAHHGGAMHDSAKHRQMMRHHAMMHGGGAMKGHAMMSAKSMPTHRSTCE